ncbi:MAG: hypothetical protein K2O18_14200 [Oscillospiraceae bacterium]|nr:hypothetical protein [Oscillospiraceae bacterium]
MSRDITKRLEALENARTGAGLFPSVSLMTLLRDGAWELVCGLWDGKADVRAIRSFHQTEEEARAAYDEFLRTHKRGQQEPVLVVDDLLIFDAL